MYNMIVIKNELFNQNKNLLIVVGQIRTFTKTVKNLVKNIVSINSPVDIIFSFDCTIEEIRALQKENIIPGIIEPTAILITNGDKNFEHPCHIEFSLSYEALRIVDKSKYDYVIITRTDLQIQIPVSIQKSFNPTMNDFELFSSNYEKEASIENIIYDYLMTSGNKEYIETMRDPNITSVWCPISQHEWNKIPLNTVIKEKIDNKEQPNEIIKQVAEYKHVNYLIGSTWLRYGTMNDQSNIVNCCCSNFKLKYETFGKIGYDDLEKSTEAQLRLSHFTYNYSLIDIKYENDFLVSFDKPKIREENYVFLLRK